MTAITTPLSLRLYLTGRTVSAERARAAIADLTCRLVSVKGTQAIMTEVIDVLEQPELAMRDSVFATPTLIRVGPGPALRLFGDLSSAAQIMDHLGTESGVADMPASGEDVPCRQVTYPHVTPSRISSLPAEARE